ncbi:NAD-dependent epimerase/dehydratase family protein [Paenibacillus amylolyticus]|uniref:NAD-dependent epimerase/dehydratase family protein n=1 Tax=Paenibacillus amylolyticus TaxID=1451 RepID=UPI003D96E971
MKTILISGANGYIGLHMATLLESLNYRVLKATRDSHGDLLMDFTDPDKVAEIKYSDIDVMIHLVSPSDNMYSESNHEAIIDNTAKVRAALTFCENNKIPSFIYVSSFHVFGVSQGELTEDSPPMPINSYGLAHYEAERTVIRFNRTNGVRTWIVRPSNVFGVPKDLAKFKRWNLIPFAFCEEAVNNHEIILRTSGKQLRNFVGVTDLCRKIAWIIREKPSYEILHAYGEETMSVLNYAYLVQKVSQEKFNMPVQIIHPEVEEEVVHFQFTSSNDCPELYPTESLEIFVYEMLGELLKRSSERKY